MYFDKIKKITKNTARNFYWGIYGKILVNPELPNNSKSALFLCKGNICRSPFAEYVSLKLSTNNLSRNMKFFSAGLEVSTQMSPPAEAVQSAAEFGITLDNHRSRKVNRDLIEKYDLIIFMEVRHLNRIKFLYPEYAQKYFLLSLFENNTSKTKDNYSIFNIIDPYGEPLDQFIQCYDRIYRCVLRLFSKLNGV